MAPDSNTKPVLPRAKFVLSFYVYLRRSTIIFVALRSSFVALQSSTSTLYHCLGRRRKRKKGGGNLVHLKPKLQPEPFLLQNFHLDVEKATNLVTSGQLSAPSWKAVRENTCLASSRN
ncbi:hypothetical protein CEXT_633351 [Caerostris extrusa]|uniref:Uncharacterized protein n=1 Tax=Caerostris extrusa TaxID=172846 RepID=A0AAV4MVY2_CAEEX|nr:hypothetical protein CEXT_633351 [Caerostris extrusa]